MKSHVKIKQPLEEQRLLTIVRRLPPERIAQLIDFAQFLEVQMTHVPDERDPSTKKIQDHVTTKNTQWDALLETDEAQRLLENMADEALTEIQAGRAKPMAFTDQGRIIPG